ncbi:hypothetical protein K3495_g9854 [Podosphaera aphanis]|nr:hypothetical protein K3495_g9854 [Podosphaera aphanis]
MSGISLKLKLNSSVKSPSASPAPGSGNRNKIRISLPSAPVTTQPTSAPKAKAGRAPKPSFKLVESRKRGKDDSGSEDEGAARMRAHPAKKVKLQVGSGNTHNSSKCSITPAVVFKQKGKPPRRNPGEGYDSEASDREEDPAIEEQFIIRISCSDESCLFLRQLIAEKKIGSTRDITMKFFDSDGRRAVVTIRNQMFAATMVDLPCILESMKSWDKRGWWKSADVSQMLLLFAPIKTEAEAMVIPLPSNIDPVTHQYPHGLTPPMTYARKRRFRKRLHKTQIEAMEDAVEKLLKEDEKAIYTSYEIIDPEAEYRRVSQAFSPASSRGGEDVSTYGGEYTEGTIGDPGYYEQMLDSQLKSEILDDEPDLDLEAELEAAMDEELDISTPSNLVATPQTTQDRAIEEEDSGDESLDEDGEEMGRATAEEIDEAEQERKMQEVAVRDDIADLEDRIAANITAQAIQSNPILRKRLEEGARKLKAELQAKKSLLGEGEE